MRGFILALSILVLFASPAGADKRGYAVGHVKNVSGTVTVERGARTQRVNVGDPIFEGDTYMTGARSAIGFTFVDGTRLSSGANSTFTIDHYEFEIEESRYEMVARLWSGTYEFVSGLINKYSPGAMQIFTPTGTVSPNGTRFVVKVAPRSPRPAHGRFRTS